MRKDLKALLQALFSVAFTLTMFMLPASCNGNEEADVFTAPIADGQVSEGEYTHSKTLSGGCTLYWSNDDNKIYIAMKVDSEGWVGIGFQPPDGNKKEGVDFILGYVNLGETKVLDLYSSDEKGPHQSDDYYGGSQSILTYSGIEQDGVTTIEFSRLLNTSDAYDLLLSKGNVKILWAFSDRDGITADHRGGKKGYDQISIE